MKKYEVLENNAGGITLYVWDDEKDKLLYAHAGYEYGETSQLYYDLKALWDEEPDISEWEGNDLEDEEIIKIARQYTTNPENLKPLTEDEYYDQHESTHLIADNDNIYYDVMGHAGHKIFDGIPHFTR